MPDLSPILDMTPPVALWAALNLFFMFMKKTPVMPGWLIPWISFALGGVIYPLVTSPGKVAFGVASPITAQVLTGLMIGGAAVGGNQLFKTTVNKFGLFKDDDATPTILPPAK